MKVSENTVVTLKYDLYDADNNELLESTEEYGDFMYIQGFGQFLPKIEMELDGKTRGYKTTIEIPVEEAYGEYDEEDIEIVDKSEFNDFEDLYEGMEFEVELDDGSETIAVVKEINGENVVVDYNHPFSGKNLIFKVEIIDVREATDSELEHEHVHHNDCGC